MSALGIVVIGRNEGDRLVRCLASIKHQATVIYVDSGSTDDSVAEAKATGASIVELDMTMPFTAARARNAGWRKLPAATRLVQFIDGDCVLQPGWLAVGQAALEADDALAVVFGRCREVAPEASRYNWLCDVEWTVAPGDARSFGGIAMVRRVALEAVAGYADDMIAGEEPELAIRLRKRNWRIHSLAAEMVLHDAAMTRLGQWWRRTRRSGHAMAELSARHRGSPMHDYARRSASALFWGAVLPLGAVSLLAIAMVGRRMDVAILGGVVALLPLGQLSRLFWREAQRRSTRDAWRFAMFLMLAKPVQSLGIGQYWMRRVSGTRSQLIEYKN